MQEIRDYIYSGMKSSYVTWLFRLRAHKHKWQAIDIGSLAEMEALVQREVGSTDSYHIVGGIDPNASVEQVPEAPPPRIYEKIVGIVTTIGGVQTFGEIPATIEYSTWGIWYNEPNWKLLGAGLPTVGYLEGLKYRGKFDRIRVCKYDSRLKCLESCELVLWDKNGVKVV